MLRALDELAERLGGDGLPGRRLARATAAARVTAWAAIVAHRGQLPAVRVAGKDLTRPATEPGGTPRPVLVVRLDATLIEAASPSTNWKATSPTAAAEAWLGEIEGIDRTLQCLRDKRADALRLTRQVHLGCLASAQPDNQ